MKMRKGKIRKITERTVVILLSICFLISLTTTITKGNEVTESTGEDKYALLVGLPGIPAGSETDLGDYLSNMFKILIGVAGVLAVIMIIIGGVMYMTVESIGGKSSAKSTINNAIFGLILALSSYLLLNTIDTNLVTGGLSLKPVPAPKETPPSDVDTKWMGVCKIDDTGQAAACLGDTLPACQASCATQCASERIYITECKEGGGRATCMNGEVITVCGTDTDSELSCLFDCSIKCPLYISPDKYLTPCTKNW